jgi:hypothetical protein
MNYQPYFRLRHVLQTDHIWWNYYCTHQNDIRPAVVDNLVKLFACGTPAMGYASFRCEHDGCPHTKRISFSCHGRYCPSCGNKATEQWVQNQLNVLPNTQWQHITFTFPCEFWPLFETNRYLLNDLCQLAAQACLTYCQQHGVTPGIFTALHTHGRNIGWHPHVHLSITAGGLTDEGAWKTVNFYKTSLMTQWRYHLIRLLRKQYPILTIPELLRQEAKTKQTWNAFLDHHYQRTWNIHLAKPTDTPQHTLNYLSRYLKRPPVSYSRITHYSSNGITYEYRSHKTKRKETIVFSADEFISRLIRHIHDKHFRVIRYYGFLANRSRKNLLPKVYTALTQPIQKIVAITHAAMLKRFVNVDPRQCILCGKRLLFTGLHFGKSLSELRSRHEALATMKPG